MSSIMNRRTRLTLFASFLGVSVGAWLFLSGENSTYFPDMWRTPPGDWDRVPASHRPPPVPALTCPELPPPVVIEKEKERERPRLSDVLFSFHVNSSLGSEVQANELWLAENNARLRALFRCLEDGNCKKNQDSVVILESYFITGSYMGWTGGESIWGRSVIKSLSTLGYTYLFSPTLSHTLHLYHLLPTLTIAILAEPFSITVCEHPLPVDHDNPSSQGFARSGHFGDSCVLSLANPTGIPLWKMLAFYYWPYASHPLGSKWTLGPEPWGEGWPGVGNTYIGYSIERQCRMVDFVPHDERDRDNNGEGAGKAQAWVMAKRLGYFFPGRSAWPNTFYDAASAASGVQFAVGAGQEGFEIDGAGKDMTEDLLPKGMKNYGVLDQGNFMQKLARSRVLIGIGNPLLSPSPYDALCLGVPFINPITEWDHADPLNKARWHTQHDILARLDPPYVYNVHQGDEAAFVKAVQDAIQTPIHSYILPQMRQEEVDKRVEGLLKIDWRGEAEKLLEKRRSGVEEGPLFMI